jgi:hypothetical protein
VVAALTGRQPGSRASLHAAGARSKRPTTHMSSWPRAWRSPGSPGYAHRGYFGPTGAADLNACAIENSQFEACQ